MLTGGFMWLTSGLTHLLDSPISALTDAQLFALLSCVLLAICGLLMVAGTVGAAGRRPYDAALVALSPLLVFHAFSNWDLFAMAFTSCALWAWARNRPVAAGSLIGLGTAAKLYPALLLIPIWILARTHASLPRGRRWATVATVLVWCAVNVPVAVGVLNRMVGVLPLQRRPAHRSQHVLGDRPLPVQRRVLRPGVRHRLDAARHRGRSLQSSPGSRSWCCSASARRRGPRMAQLAFLVVLAFLLTTKVWSPQYSIWLVPLVALARPRWGLNLLWQFSEIAVWIATLLWLLGYYDSARGTRLRRADDRASRARRPADRDRRSRRAGDVASGARRRALGRHSTIRAAVRSTAHRTSFVVSAADSRPALRPAGASRSPAETGPPGRKIRPRRRG